MRKFVINVNGKSYEVEVEEVSGGNASAPVAPVTAAPAPAPVQNAAPVSAGSAGKTSVEAPMPGTVLKINVKVGDKVASGQAVAVLEAMKMENEIASPADGVVASVNVSQGASVNTGDVLITLN